MFFTVSGRVNGTLQILRFAASQPILLPLHISDDG